MKKIIYFIIISTILIASLWVVDLFKSPIEMEVMEKSFQHTIAGPQKDIFTEIKELITFIIVTINSVFGTILLGKKLFNKKVGVDK